MIFYGKITFDGLFKKTSFWSSYKKKQVFVVF